MREVWLRFVSSASTLVALALAASVAFTPSHFRAVLFSCSPARQPPGDSSAAGGAVRVATVAAPTNEDPCAADPAGKLSAFLSQSIGSTQGGQDAGFRGQSPDRPIIKITASGKSPEERRTT